MTILTHLHNKISETLLSNVVLKRILLEIWTINNKRWDLLTGSLLQFMSHCLQTSPDGILFILHTCNFIEANTMYFLPRLQNTAVVYGYSSVSICGGGAWGWSDRKSRDRKWPWPEVTESAPTGSVFCACATGSCAISALVGPFHRKWRHQTSRDPFGVPLEG